MATKKKATSMNSEDRAFFMNAYKNDPRARKAMDADMKKKGVSYDQYFGVKKRATTKKTTTKKK